MKSELPFAILAIILGVALGFDIGAVPPKPRPQVDINLRFKRGQILDIEINGERKRISLDDFILEVTP